jgi:Uma2 family endonuclease
VHFSQVESGFADARPMTERDFFALGETADRVELFDGSLHVTVNPSLHHQRASGYLCRAFRPAAERAGLDVLPAVNVRLRPDRIPTTDLVIANFTGVDEIAVDADAVRLVCEILSPGNHAVDKVLKAHFYAAAGIPAYLIADPEGRMLYLYELVEFSYVERSVAQAGELLRLTDPIEVDLEPAALWPD